ncbi:MAG: hypothetical protein NZL90_04375 [Aquificaceae bacterium]|nr:hypothetical protein [Aquificaceae bacterium]MDW8237800.1 hypothetical protein [Aquificaceae bacterium]
MRIVAKSEEIRVVGEIRRCNEGESSKFYCLEVIIKFDNGQELSYTLNTHGEPKGLLEFLENKKGIKDRLARSFALTESGEIISLYS